VWESAERKAERENFVSRARLEKNAGGGDQSCGQDETQAEGAHAGSVMMIAFLTP